ncbi:MAG TPA: hypothetical protein VFY39_15535 [Gammaproteobacteria bacterium]|nr:hypothetical protein [Gammaproteobacteria bacterium]
MWRLCLTFVDIALHRRGPDVLPPSQFLLGLELATYFIVGLAMQLDASLPRAILSVLIDRGFYLGMVYLVLLSFDKRRRFLQTATALVGTDVFLNLVSLPLLLWQTALGAPPTQATAPQVLFLIVVVWSIDVSGYILARALSRPYIVGLSIVLVYVYLSMALRNVIFPTVG